MYCLHLKVHECGVLADEWLPEPQEPGACDDRTPLCAGIRIQYWAEYIQVCRLNRRAVMLENLSGTCCTNSLVLVHTDSMHGMHWCVEESCRHPGTNLQAACKDICICMQLTGQLLVKPI